MLIADWLFENMTPGVTLYMMSLDVSVSQIQSIQQTSNFN